jgi:hypothetical protein
MQILIPDLSFLLVSINKNVQYLFGANVITRATHMQKWDIVKKKDLN